jgi:hypothetical protein
MNLNVHQKQYYRDRIRQVPAESLETLIQTMYKDNIAAFFANCQEATANETQRTTSDACDKMRILRIARTLPSQYWRKSRMRALRMRSKAVSKYK